ncbi:hypothetical protein BU24DRAFT_461512 [Aaosphaeria arxii CBS 175.79]|uniref:Secreted protein n=1 Tax=Aaosphaeria arxii CBS 175.79 TaxID=1450172 RepID=A0A6A5XQT1_9PLEO|nr:uncharacterized protein BU24DRAFT_461512 [Aaosphaeria arxii CBS 175.79]KAF2015256.1 hypothetical protein BU24DRAFT_461512 [Aaosphaeria arxii CBS 175.79]
MKASLFLAAAAAPILAAAAPPTPPSISDAVFSGNGCKTATSARINTDTLGDWVTIDFDQLKGDDTQNCQLHANVNGASQGWQFAIKEVTYRGDLTLKSGSQLDTLTSVYFSQEADRTNTFRGQIACAGPDYNSPFTLKTTTNEPVWSKCIGSTGYGGLLNVNHRPVINGNAGTYNIKSAQWHVEWRKC